MSTTCSHLSDSSVAGLWDEIAGCNDCLAIEKTRANVSVRQSCGRAGCCDSSSNRQANGDARHAGHGIVRSAEPGEGWSSGYLHDVAFVLADR